MPVTSSIRISVDGATELRRQVVSDLSFQSRNSTMLRVRAIYFVAIFALFRGGVLRADPAEALAELQRQTMAVVERAQKSVVAIARVPKNENAQAFEPLNFSGLALRLDEAI